MYINPNASIEEVGGALLRGDYKRVARIVKEERALRKRLLSKTKNNKTKNNEKWKSRKKIFKEKLQKI